VYVDDHDFETQPLDILQLRAVTGVEARQVYYYVQRRLIPRSIGSGPGARWTYNHATRLIVIDILKRRGLSLYEIRAFLDGHTEGEIYHFAKGADTRGGISRLRRFIHRRNPHAPGEMARMEIVEGGVELFVSDKFLPRAAIRILEIERALDEILEFDDDDITPARRREWPVRDLKSARLD
jgi:DNA-binding transcriptional MerR regulator